MAKLPTPLRQVSVRTLLTMTLFTGIFAAGFRKGYSEVTLFEQLIYLIETTVVPDSWEVLGGPSTFTPYPVSACPSVVVSDDGEDDATTGEMAVAGGIGFGKRILP